MPLLKARTFLNLVCPYPAAELVALKGATLGWSQRPNHRWPLVTPQGSFPSSLFPAIAGIRLRERTSERGGTPEWEETFPGFSPTLNAQSATEIERW